MSWHTDTPYLRAQREARLAAEPPLTREARAPLGRIAEAMKEEHCRQVSQPTVRADRLLHALRRAGKRLGRRLEAK